MRKTMDAPPQGEHSTQREAGPKGVTSGKPREGFSKNARLERQVRLVAMCLTDVSRLLKQEGWIDILDDEFHFSKDGEP